MWILKCLEVTYINDIKNIYINYRCAKWVQNIRRDDFRQNKVSIAYLQKNCVMWAEHFEANKNETHFVLFLLLLFKTKSRD